MASGLFVYSFISLLHSFICYVRLFVHSSHFLVHSITLESYTKKKGKRIVQRVPQSQTAALPRHQEEEEIDKTKQAQIEQMYEKH